jgi:hypothetical protein
MATRIMLGASAMTPNHLLHLPAARSTLLQILLASPA